MTTGLPSETAPAVLTSDARETSTVRHHHLASPLRHGTAETDSSPSHRQLSKLAPPAGYACTTSAITSLKTSAIQQCNLSAYFIPHATCACQSQCSSRQPPPAFAEPGTDGCSDNQAPDANDARCTNGSSERSLAGPSSAARHAACRRDPPDLWRQLPGLRHSQGLETAKPGGYRGRPLRGGGA